MISFCPSKHEYRWNGIVKPSVTQIIDAAGLKPLYAHNMHADKGTAVHRAVELWERGVWEERGTHPELLAYLRQYLRWRKEIGDPPLVGSEIRDYSERYDYCGTVDLVFDMGQYFLIVDIKVTEHTPPKLPTALQTAGYAILIRPEAPGSVKRMSLALRANNYKSTTYQDEDDFPNFLACRRVLKLKGDKINVREEPKQRTA